MKGVNRIAQATPFARFLEQPGRHAAAENVGENLKTVERRIDNRDAGERERNVHPFELALLDMGAAAESGRFREWTRRTIETGKMTLNFGNDGAMLDRARGGHHDVGRPIVTGEVGAQLAAVKRTHRF